MLIVMVNGHESADSQNTGKCTKKAIKAKCEDSWTEKWIDRIE